MAHLIEVRDRAAQCCGQRAQDVSSRAPGVEFVVTDHPPGSADRLSDLCAGQAGADSGGVNAGRAENSHSRSRRVEGMRMTVPLPANTWEIQAGPCAALMPLPCTHLTGVGQAARGAGGRLLRQARPAPLASPPGRMVVFEVLCSEITGGLISL